MGSSRFKTICMKFIETTPGEMFILHDDIKAHQSTIIFLSKQSSNIHFFGCELKTRRTIVYLQICANFKNQVIKLASIYLITNKKDSLLEIAVAIVRPQY